MPVRSPHPTRPEHGAGAWSIADLADFRAAAYGLFAALLLPPEKHHLRWLRRAAGEFQAGDDLLAAFAFYPPWRRLLNRLEHLDEDDAAPLQGEYRQLFTLNPAGRLCLPYETAYRASGRQEAGWLAARLQHTYASAGLSGADSPHECPDHAAVELEFMAFLCGREAHAWAGRDADGGARTLAQERDFLHRHLGRWFGAFAWDVRLAAGASLYTVAAEAADAFVEHDRDLVERLLEGVGPRPHQPVQVVGGTVVRAQATVA